MPETTQTETPILNLEVPYRYSRSTESQVKAVLVSFAVFFSIGLSNSGVFPSWFGALFDSVFPASIPELLLWFVLVWPAVAVHEVGHAIAGAWAGFRIVSIKIGPFWLYGRNSAAIHGGIDATGFVTAEIETLAGITRKSVWLTIGGPLVNVILGMICQLTPFAVSTSHGVLWRAAGAMNLWMAVLALVPRKFVSFGSDGHKLCQILAGGKSYRRWLAMMAIIVKMSRSKDVRRLNERWVRILIDGEDDDPYTFLGHDIARSRACAADQTVEEALHLEFLLRRAAKGGKRLADRFALEAAVFQGWHLSDLRKCSAWYEQISDFSGQPQLQQIRYFITHKVCEGNFAEAVAKWEVGWEILESSGDSLISKQSREEWKRWREKINQRRCDPENFHAQLDSPAAPVYS